MSEKARDNKNERWKKKGKRKRQKRNKGDASYGGSVRAKWFFWAFKLGFVQLMYKAFLIFKSNLELGLSIILKERELYNQNMLSWSVNHHL